ncbi:hypothetical protein ACIBQ5_35910 [Streptomyces massasporeus]|uniref:hypothetical protein n=1 Tax=Streptomyces massasporeus TaxID=67324 RepID=UPI0037AD55C7
MRTYVQDGFEVIESEDGNARFTLHMVPTEDVAPNVTAGYARRRAELVSAIEKRDARAPKWRPAKTSAPALRLPKSADAPGFVADPFAVGDWVEWFEGDTRIVGQVWSHAPAAGSFWITTDRSGVTGRVFHMTRSKVPGSGTGKDARYTYRVGGSTVGSIGAAGADVDMTQLSDSLGMLPEAPESYADYVPPKGHQAYAPVSAYVGKVEVRGDRVWFPMVIDGVRMDADAKGNGEWLVSVPGTGREPLAVASAPVVKGMVAERAAAMLRELRERADATRHVGFGVAYSRKYVIREVEAFGRECHKCQEPREHFTGNGRMFTYEEGRERTMCATHLARALSYRTGDGRYHEVTTAAVEAIGDAQKVMGMRDSLAARAMVAMITGEVDAPAVAEAEAQEAREEASAETCAAAAEYAADRADRAAEAAESKGATDADGAWSDAETAERAARDAEVCARQIPAEREAHGERARAAVDRARDAEVRARRAANDRQAAADDERSGIAAADEAEAAAEAARDAAAAADRWATGCPRIGDFPAMLAGWVQDARAAAAEATQAAERARAAVTSREAERRPWGVIEWHTIAGACADDARDAAKRAQQSAKLAAGDRGRADRAAEDAAPEVAEEAEPVSGQVPALSVGLDADTSKGRSVRGGEGGFSPELDADASREAAPMAAEVPVEEAPRYSFGRKDGEGRYPVAVDGRPAGHVYRTRRTWWALGLDEERATDHTSRAAAAARLVALVDVRAAAAAETARKMRRRTEAPEGWKFTTWDAVGPGAIVRTPGKCLPVRGGLSDGGPLYPETWGAPVLLTGVDHLPNGCVMARGTEGDRPAWLGMGVLLSTPRYAEVGLLVPDVEDTEGPAPAVEAHAEAARGPVDGPAPAAAEAPVEEAAAEAEEAVEAVPAAAEADRPAGAGAPVGGPLSRRPHARGVGGVRAGHSTRQGAARQATRQPSHGSAHGKRAGGERGPPPLPRPGRGRSDRMPALP